MMQLLPTLLFPPLLPPLLLTLPNHVLMNKVHLDLSLQLYLFLLHSVLIVVIAPPPIPLAHEKP